MVTSLEPCWFSKLDVLGVHLSGVSVGTQPAEQVGVLSVELEPFASRAEATVLNSLFVVDCVLPTVLL